MKQRMYPHGKADARAARKTQRFRDALLSQRTVGAKIEALRKESSLTQDALALKASISTKELSDIVLGQRRISKNERKALARALAVPVEELLE